MPSEFSLFGSSPGYRDFSNWDTMEGKFKETEDDEKKKRRKELAKRALGLLPFAARVMSAKTSSELQDALSDMTAVLESRKEREETIAARKAEQEREVSFRVGEREDTQKHEIEKLGSTQEFNIEERKASEEFVTKERVASEQFTSAESEKDRLARTKLIEAENQARLISQKIESDVRRDLAAVGRQHDENMFNRELTSRYSQAMISTGVNPSLATGIAEKLSEGRIEDLDDFEKAGITFWQGSMQAQNDREQLDVVLNLMQLSQSMEVPVLDRKGNPTYIMGRDGRQIATRHPSPGELIEMVIKDKESITNLLKINLPEERQTETHTGQPIPGIKADNEVQLGAEEFNNSEFVKRQADNVKILGTEEAASKFAMDLLSDPSMTEQKALGYISAADFPEHLRRVAIETITTRMSRDSILERQRREALQDFGNR